MVTFLSWELNIIQGQAIIQVGIAPCIHLKGHNKVIYRELDKIYFRVVEVVYRQYKGSWVA